MTSVNSIVMLLWGIEIQNMLIGLTQQKDSLIELPVASCQLPVFGGIFPFFPFIQQIRIMSVEKYKFHNSTTDNWKLVTGNLKSPLTKNPLPAILGQREGKYTIIDSVLPRRVPLFWL